MTSQYITPEIVKYTEDNGQTQTEVAQNLLEDLQKEQNRLTNDFPICKQLIEEALERFYATGIAPGCELYADILNQKLIKLHQKLVLPAKLNKINFTGQGTCLKQLEDKTLCKIKIKGRNSMQDKNKEEELRQSGDVRYKHLKRNLYLELSTVATPKECYKRMAHALAEIRFLILDKNKQLFEDELNDDIKIETEVTDERLEHDPLQIVFNEPMPPPDSTETKTPMFSLANKLIELLDETVLNPNFQQTKEENMNISHDIDSFIVSKEPTNNSLENMNISHVIDSFIVSKEPTNNYLPTASTTSEETINTEKPSTKTRIQSKIKNLNKTKRKLTKSTHKTKLVKTSFKTKDDFAGIFYIKDKTTNKIIKRQISNRSILNRCLIRSNKEITEPQEEILCEPLTIDYLQQTPTELDFEYTPRDIMLSLLETMKNYPVLWEFHDKPFNADFNEAIEELCQIINDKWSLQIDAMKMLRSINRILRFYRFVFPFENMEKFADYFEICAGYLPSTVNDIPHSRCSHCFLCFKYDAELRRHLTEEGKSLNWSYKCKLCAEIFANSQEYEFHKHLPHYVEIFYCNQCDVKFDHRRSFTRHMTIHEEQIKPEEPREHTCDLCGKKFRNKSDINKHKLYHEEKKFKCHLCSKTFFRNITLMYHLKRHRKQFDVICEVCGMAFTQQKILNDHMEKHNGVQITCNICNLKLRKVNLYRHLRTMHLVVEGTIEDTYRVKGYNNNKYPHDRKKRVSKPKTESEVIPNLTFESSTRQYSCKLCNIKFDRLKFLRDHNAESHSDINKVSCKMCDVQLHKYNIRRHYREKHKMEDCQIYAIFSKDTDIDTALSMTIEKVAEL